ncbi:MAG: peptidoglycan-binding domain-containing protein, partial [Oscillospiraceae bacterium]
MSESKKKIAYQIIIIVMLNLLAILLINSLQQPPVSSIDTLSKVGSQGSEVKAIQEKLKERGIFNGSVDGIYGNATKEAVKKFQ